MTRSPALIVSALSAVWVMLYCVFFNEQATAYSSGTVLTQSQPIFVAGEPVDTEYARRMHTSAALQTSVLSEIPVASDGGILVTAIITSDTNAVSDTVVVPEAAVLHDAVAALLHLQLRYPGTTRMMMERYAESGNDTEEARCCDLPVDLHGETVGPVDGTRLWLVGGTMFTANTAILVYYYTTFYNDEYATRAPFHSFNDWYNADLNVDKLGHIWGTQAYVQALYHLFRWTNMQQCEAMYWSSATAFLFQLEMEITDGFYEKWGFSWWDMAANTVGAVWPNLQRAWPSLQPVMLKMSYRPSQAVKNGWIKHDYLRDYDGFTYWLTLSVHDVLPETLKPWWPAWLGVAVGYGADNTMLGKNIYNSVDGVGQGDQEWYISLDYDLRKLPGDTKF
ncbi:MAG: DUF2279 domain-containing protein, partial [Bacteroidetes bacterium]|nr:DUF2279 domain-containing protein [Bacteroidota bacterium]